MKLKKFKEYANFYSKDPANFEKRVVFASTEAGVPGVFHHVMEDSELKFITNDTPVILWNNFNYQKPGVNESTAFIFNESSIPGVEDVYSKFEGEDFIPRSTDDRAKVKSLKFPIVGVGKDHEEFRSYGKFRKSEKNFHKFREKITPTTRFDVISFKSRPLHIQERVNSLGFDVSPTMFRHGENIERILEKVSKSYPLDFYRAIIAEANGKLYLEKLDTASKLSPSQSIKMYEAAYEDYYHAKLPNWFKNQLFETYIKPYYKTRYRDAALLKPKHAIDFKKYLD